MRSTFIIALFLCIFSSLLFSCGETGEQKNPEEGKIFDSPISVVSDGTYLYVANANFNLSRDGDGFLAVVDPQRLLDKKNPIVARLSVPPLCGRLEIDVEKKLLYLADRRNDKIIPISIKNPLDPDTGDSIDVASEPYTLFLDREANRLFVGTLSGYLSIVDLDRAGVMTNFLLASKLSSVVMGPQRSYLAVVSRILDVVYLFDPDELEFLFSFEVGEPGLIESVRALAVSPDEKWLYVAVKNPALIAVYRNERLPWNSDRALFALVPIGCQPETILAFDQYVVAACRDDDKLIVVDSDIFYPVAEIKTCHGPVSLAVLPDPRYADKQLIAVTCFDSHEVELIDIDGWKVVAKR